MGFKKPQYTQIPNDLLDEKMKDLSLGEIKVLLVIFRQTVGYHKHQRRISRPKLAEKAGISTSTLHDAINSLKEKGMIEVIADGGVTSWSILWDDDIIPDPVVDDGSDIEQASRKPSRNKSETEQPSIKERLKDKYGSDQIDAIVKNIDRVSVPFTVPDEVMSVIDGFAQVWSKVYDRQITKGMRASWIKQAREIVAELGEVPAEIVVDAGEAHKDSPKHLALNGPKSLLYKIREMVYNDGNDAPQPFPYDFGKPN